MTSPRTRVRRACERGQAMIHNSGVIRRGVTLLEVLTAIFIMGVGLLAILTLFPLGALSMAEAVRSDRAAAIGANGSSIAIAQDLRNDSSITPGSPVYVDPVYKLLAANTLGADATGAVPTP